MSYPAQLRFKEAKVRNNLVRIGKFEHPPMEPIIGMEEPFRYRNKAQFPVGMSKDGRIIAGFYAGRTHAIIECEDCLLGVEENRVILDLVLEHMKEYHIRPYEELTGKGLVRHVMIRKGFATGAVMVCLIVNGDKMCIRDSKQHDRVPWMDRYCGTGSRRRQLPHSHLDDRSICYRTGYRQQAGPYRPAV